MKRPVQWNILSAVSSHFRKISKRDYCILYISQPVCQYSWENPAPAGRNFMKFDTRVISIFLKSIEKIQDSLKSDKTDTFLGD
jgi:hypothetical protein